MLGVAPRTGGRGLKWQWLFVLEKMCQVAPRTGGRGLKYESRHIKSSKRCRPPHRGAWIEILPVVDL